MPVDGMDSVFLSEAVIGWSWGGLLTWCLGMLLYRFWDARKWVRDKRREGYPSGLMDYLRHYTFLMLISQALAVTMYFAWASEKVGMEFFGIDLHVPHVPQLAWFMGFWSDTFANHVMKILRNAKNRAKAQPV